MLYILTTVLLFFLMLVWRYEYKALKTLRTPLSFVIISNYSIIILYLLLQDYLRMHEMMSETILIVTVGCLIFAIPAFVFRSRFAIRGLNCNLDSNNIRKDVNVLNYKLAITVIAVLSILAFVVSRIGLDNLGADEDYAAEYAGGGISGHLFVVLLFLTTIVGGQKFTIKSVLLLIPMFFFVILYQVKIWIFAPIVIAAIMHRELRGLKINILKVAAALFLVVFLFLAAYMVSLDMNDPKVQDYMIRHFLCYFFSGPGGLNEALRLHLPTGTAPFAALPSFISYPLGITYKLKGFETLYFNYDNMEWTNVMSMLGELYLLNGFPFGIIYILIISVISYSLFELRSKTHNYWHYLAYYFWSLGLIFSFYSNYYKLLSIWELMFYCFLANVLLTRSKISNK